MARFLLFTIFSDFLHLCRAIVVLVCCHQIIGIVKQLLTTLVRDGAVRHEQAVDVRHLLVSCFKQDWQCPVLQVGFDVCLGR